MAGEGQILRSAREEKSWSIADAEEQTKIRIRYLQALEDENYSVLPGAVYTKGFLRTYAKHLGINSDEVMALYKSTAVVEAAPTLDTPLTSIPPVKSRPFWLRPVVAGTMAVLALGLVVGIAVLSQSVKNPEAAQYNPTPVPSAPKQEPVTQPPANQPVTSQPTEASNVAVPPAIEGLTVQMTFTESSWLQIAVDGQPIEEETFQPGTVKEIKAKDKIELVTVGNAGGVTLTLNGKPLPSLGKSGEVVRNIVLTKNSL